MFYYNHFNFRNVEIKSTLPFFLIFKDPAFTWTEEYQAELMVENFKAFDTLRSKGYFIGEMIWNFADFVTPMGK